MKKFLLMLIILFVCGLISADLCQSALAKDTVLISQERFKNYAESKLLFKDMFWGILYERGKLSLLLFLVMLTPVKEKCMAIVAAFISFIWGFFVMSCINAIGLPGVFVGLFSLIPHVMFYYLSIYIFSVRKSRRGYLYENKNLKSVIALGLCILLFLSGCIFETLMGTIVVPWILRLSFV